MAWTISLWSLCIKCAAGAVEVEVVGSDWSYGKMCDGPKCISTGRMFHGCASSWKLRKPSFKKASVIYAFKSCSVSNCHDRLCGRQAGEVDPRAGLGTGRLNLKHSFVAQKKLHMDKTSKKPKQNSVHRNWNTGTEQLNRSRRQTHSILRVANINDTTEGKGKHRA